MDKMDKPLSDWTLGEVRELCINQSGCKGCPMSGAMCFIEKPVCPQEWDLTDKPRFTEEELSTLCFLYSVGARWLARGEKHLCWYVKKPLQREEDGKWDMQGDWGTMSGKLPAKMFPGLRPGQSVRLEDVIET